MPDDLTSDAVAAGAGPPDAVSAIPASPPRLGLIPQLGAAEGDGAWVNGLAFNPESCGAASGVADPCESVARGATAGDANPDLVEAEPFSVWAADACSTLGFRARDWEGRARRLLLACQSRQVEAELWSGALTQSAGWPNRFLTSEDSDVLTDTPATPTVGLACLEQGLAQCKCGGRGVIHATPQLVTHWAALGLVRREANQLVTFLDTIVVPGEGYDGSGPYGPAGESQWAYATSLVQIRLGRVDVRGGPDADGVDRTQNTAKVYAERDAAAAWDGCCHLAAEFNVATCGIGGS